MIRKMCYLHLANNLNDKEMRSLTEYFKQIDTDGNGQIDHTELMDFIEKHDFNMDESILSMAAVDDILT